MNRSFSIGLMGSASLPSSGGLVPLLVVCEQGLLFPHEPSTSCAITRLRYWLHLFGLAWRTEGRVFSSSQKVVAI